MKERLIGAAVLAALAVWLIPWLLDGPDEPLVNERGTIELPVPSGHVGELRTEVIDLSPRREGADPAGSSSTRAAAGSAETEERAETAARPPAPAPAPPSSSSDADPSADRAAAAATADARDADSPSLTADAVDREPGDAPSGSTGPSDARAATSSTSAGSAPRSESAASTGSAAAAREPSQVETAPSTRARGTAADAAAREAAPAAGTEANATGDWAVQLGSFGDEDNARRLADRVAAFGHAPKISTYRAGGRVMYRVRVGPQATRAAAEAAASALAAHGFPAQVVTN